MTRKITIITLVAAFFAGGAIGDTFRHRKSGEVFTGFLTQKRNQDKTLVYVEKDKSFKAMNLGEYDVTMDNNGRRNSVVVIPIVTEEALLSQGVSETICKTIVDASNKGPRYILLEIDSPGGYGEYMKSICTTITATTNCPVAAYIEGGPYGGAYAAAVPIALACEKVLVAGDAVMGSVAPPVGTPGFQRDRDEHNAMFNSADLAAYGNYVSAVASNRSRPGALAMAFLDKGVEIFEFEDKDGNIRYGRESDKKPEEKIVRTISKMDTQTVGTGSEGGVREITQMVVTLRADEAVKAGLADKVVGNRPEVLECLGAADAQVTYSRGIETAVRKFVASKRNIEKSLVQIDFLQGRVDELKGQLDRVDEQIRTSPTTRERRSGDADYYYGQSTRSRRNDRSVRGNNNYGPYGRDSEYVSGVEAPAGVYALVQELTVTVTSLTREYRRVLGLAQRDAGALPIGVTVDTLQRSLDESFALQNGLFARFR